MLETSAESQWDSNPISNSSLLGKNILQFGCNLVMGALLLAEVYLDPESKGCGKLYSCQIYFGYSQFLMAAIVL